MRATYTAMDVEGKRIDYGTLEEELLKVAASRASRRDGELAALAGRLYKAVQAVKGRAAPLLGILKLAYCMCEAGFTEVLERECLSGGLQGPFDRLPGVMLHGVDHIVVGNGAAAVYAKAGGGGVGLCRTECVSGKRYLNPSRMLDSVQDCENMLRGVCNRYKDSYSPKALYEAEQTVLDMERVVPEGLPLFAERLLAVCRATVENYRLREEYAGKEGAQDG